MDNEDNVMYEITPTGLLISCDETEKAPWYRAAARWYVERNEARKQLEDANEVIEFLISKLEYYANEDNYADGVPGRWEEQGVAESISYGGSSDDAYFEHDCGDMARQALAQIEKVDFL